MAQGAFTHAVNAHDQAAGWVGTDNATVGLHPVGGMVEALFGRQKWQRRLQGIETEVFAVGQGKFTAAQVETVTHRHIAGAMAVDPLDTDGQVVELELI